LSSLRRQASSGEIDLHGGALSSLRRQASSGEIDLHGGALSSEHVRGGARGHRKRALLRDCRKCDASRAALYYTIITARVGTCRVLVTGAFEPVLCRSPVRIHSLGVRKPKHCSSCCFCTCPNIRTDPKLYLLDPLCLFPPPWSVSFISPLHQL